MPINNKDYPDSSKDLEYIYSYAEFYFGQISWQMQWCCSYFPSRNSIRGLSMVSASASAVLWLGGPLIWYRISAIWRMQPLMRAWKLGGDGKKLDEETSASKAGSSNTVSTCGCVFVCVPLSEHSAKVVQVGAKLHLQLIEDISCLRIQLQNTKNMICCYSKVFKIVV